MIFKGTIDNLTSIPVVKEDIEESLDYDELYFYKVKTLRQYIIDNLLPEFNNLDLNEAIMFEIWF